MSTVPIKDAADATRKIDTFQRTEGADTVETQAVAVVDPTTGTPLDFATQTTLVALLTAANAIKVAAEALNTKTTAVDTGSMAGTVALDAPSLAALETVTVSNMVAQGITDAQLRATPLEIVGIPVAYTPSYSVPATSVANGLPIDPSGQVSIRGAVMTDEGTFRCNFANTSLAVSIGSVTIVGDLVTGSGFDGSIDVHYQDYFKLDADGETAWVQIDSVDSDTQITLRTAYVGGSIGAASRTIMRPVTGSGGSISVGSGQLTLTTGTTTGAITRVTRNVDIAPMVYRSRVSFSQRIANQTFRLGLSESFTVSDRWFARFKVDGTTNTTVITETGRNPTTTPSAAETETNTVTLPGGSTTATLNDYRVEMLTEKVNFFINGVLVATHVKVIPSQHDDLEAAITCINGTTPASTTTVVADYVTGKNHNKVEIGVMSDTEQIVSVAAPLQPFSYTFTGVIAINTDLIVLDCSQLRSLYIQCAAMGTAGVVTVQWCNEPTFAQPITATLLSEAGATSTTFNAAVMRVTNVIARYCRLRLTTATTALTTTINAWGAQTTYTPIITTQPVSGTVGVTGYPTAAAGADALANPTITQVGADMMVFNGTTWDRVRGMSAALTTGDTGAKSATGNGATITNIGNKGMALLVNLGAFVGGTAPTITFKLQASTDAGTSWYDIPGATTAALTATGLFGITVYPGIAVTAGTTTTGTTATANMVIPRTWRVVWTITGAPTSITITAIQYIYLPN